MAFLHNSIQRIVMMKKRDLHKLYLFVALLLVAPNVGLRASLVLFDINSPREYDNTTRDVNIGERRLL